MKSLSAPDALPVHQFADEAAFDAWLAEHHASSDGIWVQAARKATGIASIDWPGIVDVALCWGWIDGQRRAGDEHSFLQRVTPRRARSIWSKRNREKVERLEAAGRMQPAGLEQVAAARADGRWDAAYDSPAELVVPPELAEALAESPTALAAYEAANKRNRYAICWQVQTAKRAETKAKRVAKYVAMLERGELPH